MAGNEILARWRQTGAWWELAPQYEGARWLDAQGIVRESLHELPPLCDPTKLKLKSYVEDFREDIDLRMRPRKTRDEKVGRALGSVKDAPPVPFHLRNSSYVPLHVLSGYSFGRSVLLAEEIPRLAALAGLPAVGVADVFSLTGANEVAKQCRIHGIKPILGASFEMPEGGELVLLARNAKGWVSLSRLVSECHLREPRLFPLCTWERLEKHSAGLLCLTGGDTGPLDRLLLQKQFPLAERMLDRLVGLYGRDSVFVEIDRSWLPWGIQSERLLRELAERKGVRCVAGGSVTHRRRSHFPAQDVLACFKTLCRVEEVVGRKPLRDESQPQPKQPPYRSFNAERFFKTAEEMQELYADAPDLLETTRQIANEIEPEILPGLTHLPKLSEDAHEELRQAVWDGAKTWHRKVTPELKSRLEHELERIARLDYSNHFLLAADMCRWARSKGILFSGRGSAVDCAAMYCLGISRIDAFKHRLHFDRFLPDDGSKKPDIDIDFEAKRRQDIHSYLIGKYGEDHVAGVAAIGSFRTRGILREVGKALGLDDEMIGFIAKKLHGGVSPDALFDALDKRPELKKLNVSKERLQWIYKLASLLRDTPRGMSMHSSGVVISQDPIWDTVPVERCAGGQGGVLDRILQWDKRSAKRCFIKFDILCLRGQDVLSGTQSRLREEDPDFMVDEIDPDDPDIYRAMRSSQTVGIPQSASPAMTQAHVRIATQNLADASLVQAGIRPGVGGAVKLNQLIARRHGTETYDFEHPDFEEILGQTYGIIVFQEQVDQLLQKFCRFGADKAEEIREKIHEKRHQNYGLAIKEIILSRVMENGYNSRVAELVFEYVSGFKGYGFAQGHALAFAEISARSIYCQQNFPAPYFAAILDAQPAGYYGPATLVNEARIRGLQVLPPDVQKSTRRVEVEDVVSLQDPKIKVPAGGIRIDLGSITGLSVNCQERIVECRPYESFADFVRKANPDRDELEQLILCGALDRLWPNRRAMLWASEAAFDYAVATGQVGGLPIDLPEPKMVDMPDFLPEEKALFERTILGLDVQQHLIAWERERVSEKGVLTNAEARNRPDGTPVMLVGNPIRLRFPPTPSGKRVVFFDLEDETGLMNVTCFDRTYQKFGHAIILNQYITVIGRIQIRDNHPAFIADQVYKYRPVLSQKSARESTLKVADFLVS
jgi:error-prone DNA polymerase